MSFSAAWRMNGSEDRPRSRLRISWADHDGVHDFTAVVAASFVAAAGLAVFGLPPVNMHGPLQQTLFVGIMDPFCGMTRAVRLLALGNVGRAVEYNPASPLLAILGLSVVGRAAVGGLTHRWVHVRIHLSWLARLVVVVLVIALEVNQQAHAALLMRSS